MSSSPCRGEASKRKSAVRNGVTGSIPQPKCEQTYMSGYYRSLQGKETSSVLSRNYSSIVLVQLSLLALNDK